MNSVDIQRQLPPRLKYNISRDEQVNWTLCDDIVHGLGADTKDRETVSGAILLQPGHLHLVPVEIVSSVGGKFIMISPRVLIKIFSVNNIQLYWCNFNLDLFPLLPCRRNPFNEITATLQIIVIPSRGLRQKVCLVIARSCCCYP